MLEISVASSPPPKERTPEELNSPPPTQKRKKDLSVRGCPHLRISGCKVWSIGSECIMCFVRPDYSNQTGACVRACVHVLCVASSLSLLSLLSFSLSCGGPHNYKNHTHKTQAAREKISTQFTTQTTPLQSLRLTQPEAGQRQDHTTPTGTRTGTSTNTDTGFIVRNMSAFASGETKGQSIKPLVQPGTASGETKGRVDLAVRQAAAKYAQDGVTIEALEDLIPTYNITPDMTTSDVCHALIKPNTTPDGWEDVAVLIDPDKRWYEHTYRNGEEICADPPAGTFSYAEKLRRNPGKAGWVGTPNHFVSHAWSYKFVDVVAALRAYADRYDGEEAIFWFDCVSIDEHATQSFPQEWWKSVFQESIRMIGHVVMVLSPWENPIPLTRAWCLWEVYCCNVVGAQFSVTLGHEERGRFEEALCENSGVLLDAFAGIDVANAEAGKEEDRAMILAAVRATEGGTSGVNALVMGLMRDVFVDVARSMAESEDLGTKLHVASLLADLCYRTEARGLYEEVIVGYTSQLGADHTDTLRAKMNLRSTVRLANVRKRGTFMNKSSLGTPPSWVRTTRIHWMQNESSDSTGRFGATCGSAGPL